MNRTAWSRPIALGCCLSLLLPWMQAAHAQPLVPADTSPLGLYFQADKVVKGVMLLLIAASLCTWAVWIAKTIELRSGRRRVRQAIASVGKARSFNEVGLCADKDTNAMLTVATDEMRTARVRGMLCADSIKERVAARIQRLEARAGRRLTRGASVLAAIGSVGPFVGLFGTVWGVMNSFIGIAAAQTTSLAVVAPGIAEALLATGAGLVAAIPAVVGYNLVARGVSGYRMLLAESSTLVMCVLSHELDALDDDAKQVVMPSLHRYA